MGSATIYLQNNTDSAADLTLYHNSLHDGPSGITQLNVPVGGTIGPLPVSWTPLTLADYWYASIAVAGGSRPGVYVSGGPDDLLPYWKECRLTDDGDDGTSPTFTVDWDSFDIDLRSGACSAAMARIGDYTSVQTVFVLMLENHSFDNIFAFSGIDGIEHATTDDHNIWCQQTYYVSDASTPTGMPTDPGHMFADVLAQLTEETDYTPPHYPAITMGGFAARYATSDSEKTGLPTSGEIGDIMACFDTATQLPNIASLAQSYAICDHWFASLPGPTWPNRFYLHGASSAYEDGAGYTSLDDAPTPEEVGKWETVGGFAYRNGSIFDALTAAGIPWRVYHDDSGPVSGSVPQVTALKGVSLGDVGKVKSLSSLASDLQSGYPYRYTFIEPNYGDTSDNSYQGGSSQHPKDDVAGGENLIAQVVAAIKASPLWPTSLLIVTYDEHGGFYDSVIPGVTVVPAADDQPGSNGFVFNQLGVRVPAVIVSPQIAPTVDQRIYDHSSVLATIERLFGLPALTARDEAAQDFLHLLTLPAAAAAPPPTLAGGRTAMAPDEATPEARAQQPIPAKGNLQGFLHIARKTDIELAGGGAAAAAAVKARGEAIRTLGEADAYIREVMARVKLRRIEHEAALRARLAAPGAKAQPPAAEF